MLEVGPKLPVRTAAVFAEAAKREPGLPYSTAGNGTSMRLTAVLFAQMTGTQLTRVAYRGSAQGVDDMLGGHLAAMFDDLPASLPHIQAGTLTALAVAVAARSPTLPDVPTLAGAGLAGYAVEPWFGLHGPARMPPATVAALTPP